MSLMFCLVLKNVPFLSSFPGAVLKGLVAALDLPGLALFARLRWTPELFLFLFAAGIFSVFSKLNFFVEVDLIFSATTLKIFSLKLFFTSVINFESQIIICQIECGLGSKRC